MLLATTISFLGEPAPSGHIHWQVNTTAAHNGGAGTVGIAELEFRATIGGADQANGGTASASSVLTGGYVAANAFANDGATSIWVSAAAGVPQSLSYQHPGPVSVEEIAIRARNDAFVAELPRDGQVRYSDDGVSWTTHFVFANQPAWTANELRAIPSASIAYANGAVSAIVGGSLTPVWSCAPSPTFSLTAGTLPSGASLDSSTGVITVAPGSTAATASGLQVTVASGAYSATSAAFSLTIKAGYRYWGLRALTTGNTFYGCSTLALFLSGGSTDLALQSNGGVASSTMTQNGSFPATNINDGNNSSFATTTSGQAGTTGVYVIDLGATGWAEIRKVGYRNRSDSFGIAESLLTGDILARNAPGDAWTVMNTLPTQSGWSNNEYREFSF